MESWHASPARKSVVRLLKRADRMLQFILQRMWFCDSQGFCLMQQISFFPWVDDKIVPLPGAFSKNLNEGYSIDLTGKD